MPATISLVMAASGTKDGHYWISGRINDEVKGSGLFCYGTLNEGIQGDEALMNEIKAAVRHEVGPFAMPDEILFTEKSCGRPEGSCTWQDRILEQTMESADALNLSNHSNRWHSGASRPSGSNSVSYVHLGRLPSGALGDLDPGRSSC